MTRDDLTCGRALSARAGTVERSLRLAAAVALAVLLLVAARSGPAGAAAGETTAPAQQAATTVELVDQPTWVHPGDPFEVQVRVTAAPAGATIDMAVHDRLESRSAFRSTLDGELGGTEQTVDAQPLDGLPLGPGAAVTIGFTPGEAGPGGSGPGVYPVEVRVKSPDGEVVGHLVTYLSFLEAETPEYVPLEVAVLVDIAATPSLQPSGDYVLPADTLARTLERIAVLKGTRGVPLTLAPRPETLEALAQGGLPEAATVDQLRDVAAHVPVFARPFVDVDLAALQQAGLISEANAQADGGANVVRTRLQVEPTGGMWLAGPTLGAEAARLAVDLGIDRAVVPRSAIRDDDVDDDEPAAVPAAPVRLGEDGPLTMVSDSALADQLTSDDGVVAAHRFLAELAITWLEAPSIPRAVVVHLPPDAEIEPDVVTVALDALAEGPAVRPVPVDQIFDDVPPLEDGPTTVAAAPHDVTADLGPIAPALKLARTRIAGVGALLDDPAVTTSLEQSLLLSTGTDTPDDERHAYIERADVALGSVEGAVTLPDAFRITLTSRSSTIPVALENLSDQALSVRIELDSDQLEFPDGDVLTPKLAPGTTRIDVPVRTRTSGAFTLDVTVTSPDGSIVLDRSTFDVRSTAISGVGIVLSTGACLFLAIWWAKHWRSTRRSRHLVPARAAAGEVGDGAGDVVPAVPAAPTGRSTAGPAGAEPYRPAHMARPRT